jgi:butyryl-CoA dehydrogenase
MKLTGACAAERHREARFPAEAIAELGRLGFMGMLVPEQFGGAGADRISYALALEEIAAGASEIRRMLIGREIFAETA